MSEQNEPHPADKILGDDWQMPGYVMYSEAWDKHPQRELLDEHKRDVDVDGMPKWQTVRELHEDAWVEYWQRPLDPTDEREPICIGRWPEKRETGPLLDAQAIIDEYDDSDRSSS
jgi:hypothetical protein